MGKMVTKTKRVDGNLWYYRADVDEPEEKFDCEKQIIQQQKFSDVDLYLYLSSIPMDFKMGLDELNKYVGHIIYNGVSSKDGHRMYYYIGSGLSGIGSNYKYLTAKLIEVRDGEFVIKQSPTIPVSLTGAYNISTEPFYTDYPIRWEGIQV